MPDYPMRTRIKRDIACEFLPPATQRRVRSRPPNKVIILCGGMPGYPGKSSLPSFLSQKGYWVFQPRYRGSWESGGSFLAHSPHEDVLDIIDALPRGVKDAWSGKRYKIPRPEVYLIGASFGGPAAILASRDPRVRKAVALSPITDWRAPSRTEPMDRLAAFVREGFGNGYRGRERDWKKLKTGKFYNPAHETATIDGEKLLIIHPQDDKTVTVKTSKIFSKMTGAKIITPKHGGHLGLSSIMMPELWSEAKRFLK